MLQLLCVSKLDNVCKTEEALTNIIIYKPDEENIKSFSSLKILVT